MSQFQLIIATPEKEVYRDTVDSVTLPTVEGEITVLANHVPLSTILKPGALVVRQGDEEHPHAVGGGFIEVQANKLVILADTAEHVTEIDEQRAREAVERAAKLKEEIREDHVEYAGLAAKLERDLARLHVVRKHRHMGKHGVQYEGTRPE